MENSCLINMFTYDQFELFIIFIKIINLITVIGVETVCIEMERCRISPIIAKVSNAVLSNFMLSSPTAD